MADTRVLGQVARIVGAVGHVLALPWFAASGLVAPTWAVVLLLGLWAALTGAGVRWWRQRPWLVLALPVMDAIVWAAVVSAGDAWLGWTA